MGTRTIYTENIKFPGTQVASADANTLDDYEEGTWTPALSFDTPGDLTATLSTALGWYTKVGNLVNIWFNVVTSTFTHTTAAGNVKITGLPAGLTASSSANGLYYGEVNWQGITKAGYSQINPRIVPSDTQLFLIASGSGVAVSGVAVTDMPTGGSVVLRGHVAYRSA